ARIAREPRSERASGRRPAGDRRDRGEPPVVVAPPRVRSGGNGENPAAPGFYGVDPSSLGSIRRNHLSRDQIGGKVGAFGPLAQRAGRKRSPTQAIYGTNRAQIIFVFQRPRRNRKRAATVCMI